MATIATDAICQHVTLTVSTFTAPEFIDLTDRLKSMVADSGIRLGVANIQSLHTTAAIVINEHEPLLLEDFRAHLERLAPKWATYRHDDASIRTVNIAPDEPANGHAHCQALTLPASQCVNIVDGRLHVGRWQRVFLVELDGPRRRDVSVMLIGACDGVGRR